MPNRWTIVVPVKGFTQAKSRFADASTRDALARAFATDLINAVSRTPEVGQILVVTSDNDVLVHAQTLGVSTVHDPGTGLNAAIAAGAGEHHPVAALLGDLPCVRTDDISWALRHGEEHERSFIPDCAGTGTTVLMCTRGPLDPRFGHRSAAAHAASGAFRIEDASPALHRDVDNEIDLWDAVRIGVGTATRSVLERRNAPR